MLFIRIKTWFITTVRRKLRFPGPSIGLLALLALGRHADLLAGRVDGLAKARFPERMATRPRHGSEGAAVRAALRSATDSVAKFCLAMVGLSVWYAFTAKAKSSLP